MPGGAADPAVPRAVARAVLLAPPRLGTVRVVAVDGPSGSGKSTVTAEIVAELAGPSVCVVPTDHFATWDDPVSWWPRLVHGVLRPLRAGQAGHYRVMDWSGGTPRLGESRTVEVPDVLVVEGVSAGRASVRDLVSELVWVEIVPESARLELAVARDGESSREQLLRWQRFERGWFEVDRPRKAADHRLIIDHPHLDQATGADRGLPRTN